MIAQPEWLRGRVFPAIPTPIDDRGEVHREGLGQLVRWLTSQKVGGLAVWSPIGRGSRLNDDQRREVLQTCRSQLGPDQRLIATVGAPDTVRRPIEVIESARAVANQAMTLGADLLMVLPPGMFRGRPDRDRLILEYHAEIANAGLPILVSYRRETDGGIAYGPEVLAQLLARPEVMGIEIATIDGIATFQQIAAMVKMQAPEKLVVSGEERFPGYSLMCGADTLVLGLAAAYPSETVGLIDAHFHQDAAKFLELSAQLDQLSRLIFRSPMDGSTLRLLQTLVSLGSIAGDTLNDHP